MRPAVGILANALIMEGPVLPGLTRLYVNEDYVIAVAAAGAIPVILPIVGDEDLAREQVAAVDGLLISGGFDIHPREYGEDPQPGLENCYPPRDRHDRWAVLEAVRLGVPVLGICRGIQIINVVFGGNLYQDLGYRKEPTLQHFHGTKPRTSQGHIVQIEEGSWLHSVVGGKVEANSFHHQAVKDLATGFVVTARTTDGVVEGIEKAEGGFVVGVQWHPEMMVADGDKAMLGLFRSFIHLAAERKEGKS